MYCPNCGAMMDGDTCAFCGSRASSGGGSGGGQQPYVGGYGGAQQSFGGYGGGPANPYAATPRRNYSADFSDFLVPNIILTVLAACACKLVGAIIPGIGLIFSILSRNALSAGDIASARSRAVVAKVFFWISLVLILIGIVLMIIFLTSEEGQKLIREGMEEAERRQY